MESEFELLIEYTVNNDNDKLEILINDETNSISNDLNLLKMAMVEAEDGSEVSEILRQRIEHLEIERLGQRLGNIEMESESESSGSDSPKENPVIRNPVIRNPVIRNPVIRSPRLRENEESSLTFSRQRPRPSRYRFGESSFNFRTHNERDNRRDNGRIHRKFGDIGNIENIRRIGKIGRIGQIHRKLGDIGGTGGTGGIGGTGGTGGTGEGIFDRYIHRTFGRRRRRPSSSSSSSDSSDSEDDDIPNLKRRKFN